jgi:AcrR family transcriptional regulator
MQPRSAQLRATVVDRPRLRGSRMRSDDRRRQILEKAAEFFAEYGLTAQTRSLADYCGVSQRLLYRYFPTKAELLTQVYGEAILGPFKIVWLAQLGDRTRCMEDRLNAFYADYFRTVLTRRWMRLFLYSSLAESQMAPDYIASIIRKLLETIVAEAAAEQGLKLPSSSPLVHEVGWILHGAVSHFAIRRHLYGASLDISVEQVIALQVRSFLRGLAASLAILAPQPAAA